LFEAVEAELGPGFHGIADGAELFGGHELELGNHLLAAGDFRLVEVPEVDDTEVDAADFIGVVVEQGDDAVGMVGFDVDFFGDLSPDCR
jgi:hypothetical protein